MSALKAGCAGFPIGRERYFAALQTVEVEASARLSTMENIRKEAPKGFEFSLIASRVITHADENSANVRRRSAVGYFRDTPEVGLASEETRAAAEALGAKFIVYETPASFYPDADHLRAIYKYFNGLRRLKSALPIWHPRGRWELKLLKKVCADLGLIRARDPLDHTGEEPPSPLREKPALNYFRLRGGVTGAYGDGELVEILKTCGDAPSYVYFLSRTSSFKDARRLTSPALLSHVRPKRLV